MYNVWQWLAHMYMHRLHAGRVCECLLSFWQGVQRRCSSLLIQARAQVVAVPHGRLMGGYVVFQIGHTVSLNYYRAYFA